MPPTRARIATFVFFVLDGFGVGMWVVNIPTIQHHTGTSKPELGLVIFCFGLAAIVGMQASGRLSDRVGPSVVLPVAALVNGLVLVGPGLARSTPALVLAMVVFGVANGAMDVSQNAHGVQVQRAYGRPILSAFHACFSVGGLVASLVGGAALTLGVDVRATLAVAGAIVVVATLAARPWLLPAGPAQRTPAAVRHTPWTSRVVVLGLLAFLLLLAEGVAYDWSTVHLHSSLHASPSLAAGAFGAFSTTMTVVRLLADRIVHRVGSAAYVRVAALVGAAGLTGAALSTNPYAAIVCWGLFGVGLAGCVPQFFSAAGDLDPGASGTSVARVATFGYVALLGAPGVIGFMTGFMPLTTAFFLPVAGCVAASLLAPRALGDGSRTVSA